MDEIFPTLPVHEQSLEAMRPFVVHELHNQQIEVDVHAKPLLAQAEAVEVYGINGDILATIKLPGQELSKEIAIVDYGEPDPSNPKPVFIFEGAPIPLFGKATERYGLTALNYTPEGHLSTHVGFSDGAKIELGRDSIDRKGNYDANYKLGLSDGSNDMSLISRQHATITLQDGKLTITDHSTNGSLARIPNYEDVGNIAEVLQEELGHDALEAAGMAEPNVAVRDLYGKIASEANMLGTGTYDPAFIGARLRGLLQQIPESEVTTRAELGELMDQVANRGNNVEVAKRITEIVTGRTTEL